ncbi:MAG: TonB-dependent receptor [Bacteroidota bacterium]|nr:TonB-dependent receptor [Bacteroidota bacterium]
MRAAWILTLVLGLSALLAQAQSRHTVSGYITDASSGETLIGATVWVESMSEGVASNIYGFYTLTLPAAAYDVRVSYLGYTPQRFEVDLTSNDLKFNMELQPGLALDEAVVTGERENRIEEQVQMSRMEIPIDQIKSLPAIGGEVDLLKSLQLLPGVQSGGEGTSGLYVRGGSPDQNLMLLDGVPLYSVNHLFGFFSVFNADAVKNMSITKGGFPARFGGRLSSILEINMKDGNMREFHGDGNISIIASKLTLEGPIVKDKASFMVSARRTYLDLLLRPIISAATSSDPNTAADPAYFFYDLNGKLNWRVSSRDRIYLSAFSGLDDFGIVTSNKDINGEVTRRSDVNFGLDWKNQIQALRWNHELGPRMFSNVSLTHSIYNFNTGVDFREEFISSTDTSSTRFASLFRSGIEDYAAKIDVDFAPNARHFIRFGGNVTRHQFSPGALQFELDFGQENPLDTLIGQGDLVSHEQYLYVEDEVDVAENLSVNVGLHGSMLNVEDTSYSSLQPRLALNWKFTPGWAFKASYANMVQYVNLLTNEGLSLPTDLWLPSTGNVRPQRSWQAAAGLATSFNDGGIEVSLEGYYKEMDGLLSYKEGGSFLGDLQGDWESQVTQGIGNSYGVEALVQKKAGRTAGWIGYTLSWSNRQFDDLNSGAWFPFTYDRRHDVSVVVTQELSDIWSASMAWVYGTGRAVTLTESVFNGLPYDGDPEATEWEVPSRRNAYRMSPYHRLDISFTRTKPESNGNRALIFSAYNAYNNLNPFFALAENQADGSKRIYEYGLFPIIPSIAWRFHF